SVPTKWIFQHKLISDGGFRVYNLTKVQRTSNEAFATTLNKLRVGFYDHDVLTMIRSRINAKLDGEAVVLMSKVRKVATYNARRLEQLEGNVIVLDGFVKIREEARFYGDDYVR